MCDASILNSATILMTLTCGLAFSRMTASVVFTLALLFNMIKFPISQAVSGIYLCKMQRRIRADIANFEHRGIY